MAHSADGARLERHPSVSEDDFFRVQTAPKERSSQESVAREFIASAQQAGRRVALVTSGGTTVPLEQQTVRFIDNFSAGTRGATSAEYFLEAGYAVIFLHRKFSLQPYSRHYSHTTNCFLDFMAEDDQGRVAVRPEYQASIGNVLAHWTRVKAENRLLMLPFVSVSDYLWALRDLSLLLQPLGPDALMYLAAAVSDFFVPKDRLAEHKIQSTNAADPDAAADGDQPQSRQLVLGLDPVPKFLKRLVDGWAPHAFIVSFKLETDPNLLIDKAQKSLKRYEHQLVIGNLLSTRSWEVVLIEPGAKERWLRVPAHQLVKDILNPPAAAPKSVERQPDASPEIESLIVPEVVKLHSKHIAALGEKA